MFTLYALPGEKNSEKAIALLNSDIKLLNVRTLKNIPDFVDGVPTLANYKTKEAFKGTRCLEQLELLKKSFVSPASAVKNGRMTFGAFQSGKAISLKKGSLISLPKESHRVLDGKVKEKDVNAYMSARNSITHAK